MQPLPDPFYGSSYRVIDGGQGVENDPWRGFKAAGCKCMWKLFFLGLLAAALALTYQRCYWCVLSIMVISAVTMNCIPFMPVIFLVSLAVLLMHAVDYDNATIKVEVPLQNMVYVPTWNDVQKYVSMVPAATSQPPASSP